MILTVEGRYSPSSRELSHFEMRRHVLSIIWGTITARASSSQNHVALQMMDNTPPPHLNGQNHGAPQMMDCTGPLRSKSYSLADDGQYVPSPVKIIWGALRF
jgi:hypothetical protein